MLRHMVMPPFGLSQDTEGFCRFFFRYLQSGWTIMLFFTRATQPNVFSSCASKHIFIVLVDNLQFVVPGVGDYEITKNSIFRNHGRHVASSKMDLELILIILALLSHCFFLQVFLSRSNQDI